MVYISKIIAHKRSGNAGSHEHHESLPTSTEVPGGQVDVRQCSHGCLHQEGGGTQSYALMQGCVYQRLFVHWNPAVRDIMRTHISKWIMETIKEAYTWADRQYGRVTADEVRALTASWAYSSQMALPDILSAAFWRSSGSSRVPIFETWPALLMGWQPWVLWWSRSTWLVQDLFTLPHILHDLYAATAAEYLMKITWLLAGIFIQDMQ